MGDFVSHMLCFGKKGGVDDGGLETLAIVSTLLNVSYWWAKECRTILLGNGKKSYLLVEVDKLLNDNFH